MIEIIFIKKENYKKSSQGEEKRGCSKIQNVDISTLSRCRKIVVEGRAS